MEHPRKPLRHQDPQDKEFGATAAADQELVDTLDDQGISEDQLPAQAEHSPRAAGKAKPTA